MEEIWKNIKGYEGIYQVSNFGRVKNVNRDKILSTRYDEKGYCTSNLFKNGYGIRNIEQYFSKDDEVYIIGCEIDACVMAICFQLFDLNINFFVLSDYVYTTSKFFTKEDVLNLYIRNFRKCVI